MDIAVTLQFQCSEGGDGIPEVSWLARQSALAGWLQLKFIIPSMNNGKKNQERQLKSTPGLYMHWNTGILIHQTHWPSGTAYTHRCASYTCIEGERKILDFYRYPQSNYGMVIMGKFVLLGIVFTSQSTYNIQL